MCCYIIQIQNSTGHFERPVKIVIFYANNKPAAVEIWRNFQTLDCYILNCTCHYTIPISCFLVLLKLNDVVAILGEHKWHKDEKSEQKMSISQVHLHPQYNESTYDFDIALFKFTKQAIYTDYVIPVCLPITSADFALSNAGHTGRISGWGARKADRSQAVKRLHTVQIPIVGHKQCKANHAPKWFVSENMLCAGRIDGKGDACKGDSGGPLTVENRATGKHVLVGIVSWGESCGQKYKYGVYTKVKNFVSWINIHIKNV